MDTSSANIVPETPGAAGLIGLVMLARLTAPAPPVLLTTTPGASVTVNASGGAGGGVVGPPKLMLVLKVPVQAVLGEPAVRSTPRATGLQVCASAGSDKPRYKGAR